MTSHRGHRLLAAILLLATWTAGASAEHLPVTLGLVVPMAGEAGRVGRSMRLAAEMAVADWQRRLGRPVTLTVKEDQFDPRQAAALAHQLAKDGVWGVVGHYYSSSSIPAAAVYAEAGIPQITPTATHPRLTAMGYPTVFRMAGRDDQQAVTAADFLVDRLRRRRVAVIQDRTEYGQTLAASFRRALDRRAPRRIVLEESVAQGDKQFDDLTMRIADARPDAVYFGGIFREAALLLKQIRRTGIDAAFLSGDGVLDPEFISLAGESALAEVYLTFMPDPRTLPTAQPVIQRYEAKHGTLGPYVLYTYDAVGAYCWALEKARPTSAAKEELAKLLQVLRRGGYPGALGTLRWDARGDRATSPYIVYTVKKDGSLHRWFEPAAPQPPEGPRALPSHRGARRRPQAK